ncbi:MAG: DEAD/DEAH box helicase [Flavobacteriales bacterium]|nr:DEAD/DEAH box helicase [Flavobacteriales bacterium]
MNSFASLGLSAPILEAIGKLGFETPTEIQEQAIPRLIEGDRDFIGLAQTGTGKTAAFGLPLLEHLDADQSHVQALILAPTRELGQQIAEQIALFAGRMKGIRTVAVYGGANIVTQINQLKRPCQVVIATPGRLIDLAKRKAVKLDRIKFLVLDEADEMLNMGFKEELDTILSFTPDDKKTWLFSATMPKEIRRMVKDYMEDPFEVRVDPKTTVNTNIDHQYAVVRHTDKAEALTRFMDLDPELYGVVFCRTKRDTQNLAEGLIKQGYRADAIHGDLSQHQRDRVMMRFKRKELQVLIATDVAARGIDVNDLTHVFHFSLPNDQAYYTHRSGRTARAGKKGVSLAFIGSKEKGKVNQLARGLDVEFTSVEVPKADQIVEERLRGWARGLVDQQDHVKAPQGLLEEVDLLLGPLSKEDIIARLVSRELARLNLSNRQDLNQKGGKDDGGYRDRKDFKKGGFKKGGYKKDFKGGSGKGGFKKDFKKGGYKKGGYKKPGAATDSGFNSGFNDGGFPDGETRADGFRPKKSGGGKGGYKKDFKKGGYKKSGGSGGFSKPGKRKY